MKLIFENITSISKRKHLVLTALFLIVLLGAGLRIYKLNANSFVADEFLDINSTYGYFKTHAWQAWDFNLGKTSEIDLYSARDERAWLYKWQVAALFKFLPPTEATARSISVIWGIISIFIIYWTARYFTKKKSIGLLSAFLFAVSVTAITFDRKFRMYAMFYPLYLLLSLWLFQFFEEDYQGKLRIVRFFWQRFGINIIYLIPLLIVATASLSIQLLTINIIPVFLFYTFIQTILLVSKKQFFNKYSTIMVLAIFGSLAAYLIAPKTVLFYSGVLKFFINNQEYFLKILQDYSNYLVAIFFLISGIYFMSREKLGKPALWLCVSLFVPLFMAAFLWKRAQGIQYVFFLQSFLIILIAAGVYFWAVFFRDNLKNYAQKSFFAVITLALLTLPNYGYFFSNDTTYHRDINNVADYRKVFTYVKKYLRPGEAIITRNFRNYYLSGVNAKVFDFGGERAIGDLSLLQVQEIKNQNPSGWIVLFDNDADFISKDAMNYIKQNFITINTSQIRGTAKAYRWGNN